MSLFSHYPAKASDVLAQGDRMLGGSGQLNGLGATFSGRTASAVGQALGDIVDPILGLDRPVTSEAEQLSSASTLAGGAMALFAKAVSAYDDGVDELNRIYDEAKAANFHAAPVAADATGADGEPMSDADRQSAFDNRVAAAKTALEATLGKREEKLMSELDTAASGTAGLLNGNVGSSAVQSLIGWFGGSPGGPGASAFAGVSATGTAVAGTAAFANLSRHAIGLFGLAGDVVDRGSTLAVYGWDTTVRRVTNPGQTVVDVFTGTAPLEDLTAVEAIVVEDGELYREGPYGSDAAFITGVSVPGGADAITLGHTVRMSDDAAPDPSLVEHEMQHVYDVEDVGAGTFYGDYLGQYVRNRWEGDSHDEAYHNISWEESAYEVGDDPDKKPEGVGGVVSDVVDWIDSPFN